MAIIRDFIERIIKNDQKTFVEAYRTSDTALAGLIKEVLEDHQILCYVDSQFSTHTIYPLAYRGIKVMVYKDHIEEAKRIIDLFFREDEQP